jgi:hypothetical protein
MKSRDTLVKVSTDYIQQRIHFVWGVNVILDSDVAALYEVPRKVLMQSVKRNAERFSTEFMFRLTNDEEENLRSQIVTSSWGGRRNNHYAFTDISAAMLSSVLRSKRAIHINKQIIKTFVKFQHFINRQKELPYRVVQIEKEVEALIERVNYLMEVLEEMRDREKKPDGRFGFVAEPPTSYRVTKKKTAN